MDFIILFGNRGNDQQLLTSSLYLEQKMNYIHQSSAVVHYLLCSAYDSQSQATETPGCGIANSISSLNMEIIGEQKVVHAEKKFSQLSKSFRSIEQIVSFN